MTASRIHRAIATVIDTGEPLTERVATAKAALRILAAYATERDSRDIAPATPRDAAAELLAYGLLDEHGEMVITMAVWQLDHEEL